MVQEKADALRQTFLEGRISHLTAINQDKQHATRLKAILRAEYLKKVWPRLRRYAKGQIRFSLTRIEVPVRDKEGEILEWQSVISPEKNLLRGNQKEQATFRPGIGHSFCGRGFGDHLHPFDQNSFSEFILDGSVKLDIFNINDEIKACLQEMQIPEGTNTVEVVDSKISAEDFVQGFKCISKKLTSSPSGCHYGHYKAVLSDAELCSTYATLMSLPFEYGFSLQRWEQVFQTMLEKNFRHP